MSEFEKFRVAVLEDVELQRRLLAEKEWEPFIELLVAAARERGFAVAEADVRAAIQEARKSWFERLVR